MLTCLRKISKAGGRSPIFRRLLLVDVIPTLLLLLALALAMALVARQIDSPFPNSSATAVESSAG